MKVLEPRDPALREELLARFRNEVRLIARVRDPRILPVYQSGEHQGRLWLAMERADGGTLEEWVASGALVSEAEVLRIGREIARGLQSVYEQEQIIHRDIKPSNVFLTRNREIRIADFGLAKVVTGKSSKLTDTGTVMGTPAYLAPEVIRGEPVDHRADIYALGCLMYEMLVQLPPFDGDTTLDVMYKHVSQEPPAPRELRPEISERLNAIVMRCLKKNREERFPTYRELIAALEPDPSAAAPSDRPSSRRRVLAVAFAATAVGAAAAAWALMPRPIEAPAPPPAGVIVARSPEPPPPQSPDMPSIEELRQLLRTNPSKALEIASKLRSEFPDRKDLADLVFRAHLARGEFKNEAADLRYLPILKHVESLKFDSVAELEHLIRTADELQQQAANEERDSIAPVLALAVASMIMDYIGAEKEAAALKARAQELAPCQVPPVARGSFAALLHSAETASKNGDWSPAKRLRAVAQRFSLQHVLEKMSGIERELHAAELMEMGNDADVLQNYSGTRAFAEVTEKVRTEWKRWNRKDWIPSSEAWTKRGPDLSKSRFEFTSEGLSIESSTPAYAECSLANAEQGIAIEVEGSLEATGWASIVVNPDTPVHVSIFRDRVEVISGQTSRVRRSIQGRMIIEAIPYRDHLLIFLQEELLDVFSPGEGKLDSVVRIGVCKGRVNVKKVEVPE